MKIKLNDKVDSEIKEFLLGQTGITDVDIKCKNYITDIKIKHTDKTTPEIIMRYIELFGNYKNSYLLEFDKENISNINKLKYIVDDMCCEYCYMGLVMCLFENDMIKSVKSNFDFKMPAYNTEFIIEYNDVYSEEEIIKYLKENI